MSEVETQTIEGAFARAEGDADLALKAAQSLVSTLKRYRTAASLGRVSDLRTASDAAANALQALDQAIVDLAGSWEFDEQAYLEEGGFTRELIASADEADLRISELDGRLYCYPALLRIVPADAAVMIDKTRERRIRPSVLVKQLREMQRRPARFQPAQFLEALYSVYANAIRLRQGRTAGSVVPLVELYDLMTPKPGDTRDYTRQEFARDIYLLDQSTEATTKSGASIQFHAGAGARLPASQVLSVVSQQGREIKYHGVAFSPPSGA